jgi:glycosyltransferase involved in cell wall biosynthesis
MTKKILHLITDLNTGGAENSLYRLLAYMDREEFDSHVISLIPPGVVGEKIRKLGIPVVSLDMKPGRPSLYALFNLSRQMHNERFDIVQTWLYHADLMGLLAAKMANMDHVVWNIRNSYLIMSEYRRMSGLVLKICSWLSGSPEVVICNSQAGREFHTGLGYHPRRWMIIPNGFDPAEFHPEPLARLDVRDELGLDPDAILIGMTARYDPIKGHTDFLESADALIRSGVDAHFLMVGQMVTYENETLSSIIAQRNLQGRVHLLGRRDDMPRLYASLDVFSLTSSGEGFPNVVAEAMACGVPCVATDVGDTSLIVGDTGRIVPPRDPVALARAWADILSFQESERRSLGLSARQRIINDYSLDKMVSAYSQLYRDIIAEPK